jgi:hypothetical protein
VGFDKLQLENYNKLSKEDQSRLADKYMLNLASIFKNNPSSPASENLLQTALQKWEEDNFNTEFF